MRLDLEHVTAGYGDTIVLRDVNLTVPDSRVVALLGANGAGKTTLLSTVSGLVRQRSGHIKCDDVDMSGRSTDERVASGICHVTESGGIFPGLSVAENLRMFSPAKGHQNAVDRAVDAFPRLGERLKQIAGTMSGGEQRMLSLARAYTRDVSIVMVDEISMGLAPVIVDEIFEFLSHLASQGVSLLVVEQYISKVLAIADLVYVLSRGRVVFAGEPRELRKTDLLAQYLGEGAAVGGRNGGGKR